MGAGRGFLLSAMRKATPIHYVPAFDGKASSYLDFEQRVMLRNGSTDVPMERRAALLILQMDAAARRVCLHTNGDTLMEGDDVLPLLRALRDSFRPHAIDHVFEQVDKFMTYGRTDQPIVKFLTEFGNLRRKSEKHLFPKGSGSPD